MFKFEVSSYQNYIMLHRFSATQYQILKLEFYLLQYDYEI
jgi:hypothetical protein